MQSFDIVTIRLFLAIAEAGSIAGAARREHIAASAVSRRIQDLELMLGAPLLERRPRGVVLTPAGEVFAKHGRRLLTQVRDLDAALKHFAEGDRGRVRIAAVTSAIVGRLADLLKDASERWPDIGLELVELYSAEAVAAIRDGDCDLGIVADSEDLAGLAVADFCADPVWVVGARDHPLFAGRAADAPVAFAATLDHPVISLHQGGVLDEMLQQAAESIGKPLEPSLRVTRFDSLRRLVEAGLGVGFLRESSVKPYLTALAIEGAPLGETWARSRLKIVTREAAPLAPAARTLLDFLEAETAALD
ncbi:MAG: LysR substrate-binding domain-containing protein [Kiloniellales bacterium]|nr:LysR substrate-binding domain-containing protein [Kiloniellales bacterium]